MKFKKLVTLGLGLLFAAPASAAQINMQAAGAIAPQVRLTTLTGLSFGELIVTTGGTPGYFEIDPATGLGTPSNASQVGSPARGSFSISGRTATNVGLTFAASGFVCDTAYLNPCVGTPILTLTNTFTAGTVGQISNANCTGLRCTDTIYVGGRFAFTGNEEGRWTNTLTITANYQ